MKKHCSGCLKNLPMAFFGYSKKSKDNKRHICRACTSDANARKNYDNRVMSKEERAFFFRVAA
jgi:predicted Fe-S protein YdhL (DUF1289 family)